MNFIQLSSRTKWGPLFTTAQQGLGHKWVLFAFCSGVHVEDTIAADLGYCQRGWLEVPLSGVWTLFTTRVGAVLGSSVP